jgi:hypothetical protein
MTGIPLPLQGDLMPRGFDVEVADSNNLNTFSPVIVMRLEHVDNTASCVQMPQIFVKFRRCCRAELNYKNLCELLNAKWATGHREELKQTLCIFSILFIHAP